MNQLVKQLLDEIIKKVPDANVFKHNERRFYISIPKEKIYDLSNFLYKDRGLRLSIATGIDTREGIEILYHFSQDATGTYFTLKILVPKDNPTVKSIAPIFESANWIEREMHELLGINFEGHPNLKPLLTPEDWQPDQYPLRRDYE